MAVPKQINKAYGSTIKISGFRFPNIHFPCTLILTGWKPSIFLVNETPTMNVMTYLRIKFTKSTPFPVSLQNSQKRKEKESQWTRCEHKEMEWVDKKITLNLWYPSNENEDKCAPKLKDWGCTYKLVKCQLGSRTRDELSTLGFMWRRKRCIPSKHSFCGIEIASM